MSPYTNGVIHRTLSGTAKSQAQSVNTAQSAAGSSACDSMPGNNANGPKWFTPGRLLLIFCLTNLVVYLDRGKLRSPVFKTLELVSSQVFYDHVLAHSLAGLIASNGVNGSPRTVENPSGTGIQV